MTRDPDVHQSTMNYQRFAWYAKQRQWSYNAISIFASIYFDSRVDGVQIINTNPTQPNSYQYDGMSVDISASAQISLTDITVSGIDSPGVIRILGDDLDMGTDVTINVKVDDCAHCLMVRGTNVNIDISGDWQRSATQDLYVVAERGSTRRKVTIHDITSADGGAGGGMVNTAMIESDAPIRRMGRKEIGNYNEGSSYYNYSNVNLHPGAAISNKLTFCFDIGVDGPIVFSHTDDYFKPLYNISFDEGSLMGGIIASYLSRMKVTQCTQSARSSLLGMADRSTSMDIAEEFKKIGLTKYCQVDPNASFTEHTLQKHNPNLFNTDIPTWITDLETANVDQFLMVWGNTVLNAQSIVEWTGRAAMAFSRLYPIGILGNTVTGTKCALYAGGGALVSYPYIEKLLQWLVTDDHGGEFTDAIRTFWGIYKAEQATMEGSILPAILICGKIPVQMLETMYNP